MIFKRCYQIQNGRQRSTPKKFVGAKTIKVRNYSNFTITFPTIWRCAGDIFKVLLKSQMAATDQLLFLGVAKTQKNSLVFFFIFNITFLGTGDFLKMLPKFKMVDRSQLQNFLWAQKL